MNSQEVVDFVKKRLEDPEKKKKLSIICEEVIINVSQVLLNSCLQCAVEKNFYDK